MATRPTRSSSRPAAGGPKSVSALVVKEGEGAWTKAEIKEVLSELHQDRDRVVRTLSGQEAELDKLMRDAGDGAGHDQADMGATSFERDQEIIVVNNEREKLAQIDRALATHRRRHLRHLRVVRQPHRQDAGDGLPPCHTVHDMQAARGASLTSSDAGESGPRPPPRVQRPPAP